MNNKFGFTLIELVVTIVVVGVVAAVSVPAYRSYISRSIATEGKALVNEINAAQQIYYARNGKFYAGTNNQQYASIFGVDTRTNKYFTNYTITVNGDNFTAQTNAYKGKALTIQGSLTGEPVITDSVSKTFDMSS